MQPDTTFAVWSHNRGSGGGHKWTAGTPANECLSALLQTPPLPGAARTPSLGQSRGHQNPGWLVGCPGTQRETEIHWHGQGGEATLWLFEVHDISMFCSARSPIQSGATSEWILKLKCNFLWFKSTILQTNFWILGFIPVVLYPRPVVLKEVLVKNKGVFPILFACQFIMWNRNTLLKYKNEMIN